MDNLLLLVQLLLLTIMPYHQAVLPNKAYNQGMLIPSSKGCPLLTPSHSCSWKIIVGGRSRFGEFNTVGSIIQLWKVSSTASVFMYCQSDGTYNTPSDCVTVSKVGCVAPSKPLQTYLHFSPGDPWFSVGRAVRYFCDNPGYELKGNTTRTCITSNIWSGQLPTCKLKTEGCQYPGSFDNGYYTDSTEQIYNYGVNPINEVIVAYCHKTFSLHNQPAESTCQSGGVWSGGNPHCVLVTCGPLNPPSNAFYLFMNGSQYSYGKLPFGTNIYLKCGEMFHSVGNIYSLCQSDGTWSNRNHSCMHVTCKEPNLVTNGGYFTSNNSRYTGWNVNVNTHIYGFCEVGYFSPHNLSRTCTANGSWSGVAPSCSRITCRPPSAYNNGGYYLNFGNFSKFSVFQLNASIFVECHTGFTITTSAHRQCILIDNSGKWSGEDPVCSTVTPPETKDSGSKVFIYFIGVASSSIILLVGVTTIIIVKVTCPKLTVKENFVTMTNYAMYAGQKQVSIIHQVPCDNGFKHSRVSKSTDYVKSN